MTGPRHLAMLSAFCLSLGALCLPQAGLAQSADGPTIKPIGVVQQKGPVPSLFVLNADSATLAGGKLTLTGFSPNAIVFADRPVRAAGHLETKQFIDTWNQGEDNFGIDPPNATISLLDGSTVADAVVTISDPVIQGDTLTFTAVVLEGSLDAAKGMAALFIDDRGGGGGGRVGGGGGDAHFNNYATTDDQHAAYYSTHSSVNADDTVNRTVNVDANGYRGPVGYPAGVGVGVAAGAAVGAAAANRWNGGWGAYPPCGYPPYPPCY